MAHRHDFETMYRPSVAPAVEERGIKAVEIRECTSCGKKVPFVLIKEEWFTLYIEPETEEQDILLA
jgi:hypothetical protein